MMPPSLARFKPVLDALTSRKDVLGWVVKYGALLVVFLFFFIPMQSRLSSYASQNRSLQKQITDLKQVTASLLTPAEIDRVRGRVLKFEEGLTDETKTDAILDLISEQAEKNHLKIIQIYSDSPTLVKSPEGAELEVGGKKLHILPVNIRLESDYKSFGNFLKAMNDTSSWIFTVESLQLQPIEADSLQCDLTLSFVTR